MGDILESNISKLMGMALLEKGRRKKMPGKIITSNCLLKNLRWMSHSGIKSLGFSGCVFKPSISPLVCLRISYSIENYQVMWLLQTL